MKQNKLVSVLVLLVFLIVGGIVTLAANDESLQTAESDSTLSFFDFGKKAPVTQVQLDADTAEHTLSNIARDSADIRSQFKDYQEGASQSQQQIDQLAKVVQQLTERNQLLEQQITMQSGTITQLQQQPAPSFDIDSLRSSLVSDIKTEMESLRGTSSNTDTTDYEIHSDAVEPEPVVPVDDGSTSRVRSINLPLNEKGQLDSGYLDSLKPVTPVSQLESERVSSSDSERKKSVVIDPRYTVFADSILNDALTVTHLIGRIPRDGDISDPAPFKVIIGSENLAANGFEIPNLKGMIMSGIVYGDSMLKCVRTKLKRATYIFEDGRGITFPSGNSGRDTVIGYLTDPYGNPCIQGTYYTNAKQQLQRSFLTGLAAGAANAFAASQTTTNLSSTGSTSSSVTGDTEKYIAGVALSNGTNRIVEHLQKQEFDIWDAVVVPSGQRVAVHMETTLELDQTSLQRRVVYAPTNNLHSFTD